jgi:hypothetical protein
MHRLEDEPSTWTKHPPELPERPPILGVAEEAEHVKRFTTTSKLAAANGRSR